MNTSANEAFFGENDGVGDREHEITLHLLDAVTRDSTMTQRRIASELGVALGLVNAYFKRCVKKGLIKVGSVPKRRYAYYLTPQGFAEKARLTRTYLTHSFTFFRNARQDCLDVVQDCAALGWNRVALAGNGDLAEIMILCAADSPLSLLGVIDPAGAGRTAGVPIVADAAQIPSLHGVIVTDMEHPQMTYDGLVRQLSPQKVKAPSLLRIAPLGRGAA